MRTKREHWVLPVGTRERIAWSRIQDRLRASGTKLRRKRSGLPCVIRRGLGSSIVTSKWRLDCILENTVLSGGTLHKTLCGGSS